MKLTLGHDRHHSAPERQSFENRLENYVDALDDDGTGSGSRPTQAAYRVQGENIPAHFNIRFRDDFGSAAEWMPLSGALQPSLSIQSEGYVPANLLTKIYALPIADGQRLHSLELKTSTGNTLELGKDYIVRELTDGRSGAWIQLTNGQVNNSEVSLSYKLTDEGTLAELPTSIKTLDPEKIRLLLPLLDEAGFTLLSGALSGLLSFHSENQVPISFTEVQELFLRYSRYSTNGKVSHTSDLADLKRNPFMRYSTFMSEDGFFCTQCHGSNLMAQDFFSLYIGEVENPKASSKTMAVQKNGYMVINPGHAQLEFQEKGRIPRTVDFTPTEKDPSNATRSYSTHETLAEKTEKMIAKNPSKKLQDYLEQLRRAREDLLNALKANPNLKAGILQEGGHPTHWLLGITHEMELLVENPKAWSENLGRMNVYFPGGGPKDIDEFLNLVEDEGSAQLRRLDLFNQKAANPRHVTSYKMYADPLTVERAKSFFYAIKPRSAGITMSNFLWHWQVVKPETPMRQPIKKSQTTLFGLPEIPCPTLYRSINP